MELVERIYVAPVSPPFALKPQASSILDRALAKGNAAEDRAEVNALLEG